MPVNTVYKNRELADQLGHELDAIRIHVMDSRNRADAAYIFRIIRCQRLCDALGRIVMFFSLAFHPSWNHDYTGWVPLFTLLGLGIALLALAKILANMEIGHNILHGQWDWMGDPEIQSSSWEWDTACPAEQWKHTHNVIHHTWTNVVGRDRDVGYGIMRMSDLQPWEPKFIAQVFYNIALATWFEYGVALHDLELERVALGERNPATLPPLLRSQARKIGRQMAKDYLLYPVLAGPFFFYIAAANAVANIIRNVWAYIIIFCGHFPSGVQMFTENEIQGESRGQWYVRQILGSCNISGGKLFHILSGNLSHQIEHHLFPDMPSTRYQEVAPLVRQLASKYGIPYNTRSLSRQFGSTVWAILKYSFPTATPKKESSESDSSVAA
jgi:fatty acid desaturase